ncbi:MAG: stage II sporulation protein P [Firmicutes bacterium]|nr:stage II sporulation protein P [Bacillota bacterium]
MARWKKPTMPRFSKVQESNGPGLLFILVALVAVAVAGARLLGFGPGQGLETVQTRIAPPPTAPTPAPAPPASQPVTPERSTATVVVYHTHATENYGPGEPHARDGRPGHVVEVGEAMAQSLEGRGLRVVHHTAVYDYPRWGEAYANAAQAVSTLIREQGSVAAVIDIHRDAIAQEVGREFTTATVGGRPVARILLVVGDQNNPYARENTAFAEALKAKMDALYPGLSRGIRVQASDYNGRLHPRSVQAFIGDQRYNTVEEAREAARMLAHAVSEVLREQGGV